MPLFAIWRLPLDSENRISIVVLEICDNSFKFSFMLTWDFAMDNISKAWLSTEQTATSYKYKWIEVSSLFMTSISSSTAVRQGDDFSLLLVGECLVTNQALSISIDQRFPTWNMRTSGITWWGYWYYVKTISLMAKITKMTKNGSKITRCDDIIYIYLLYGCGEKITDEKRHVCII